MHFLSDDSFSSNDVEQLISFYAPANDITAIFFFECELIVDVNVIFTNFTK